MSEEIKEYQKPLVKALEDQDYRFRMTGSKCYETGLSRDERYLLNKLTSDRIQKLEEKKMSDNLHLSDLKD
jgi:hypothetical protein